MVTTIDARATLAGLDMLRAGGHAVDAAIAANAVLAVVAPYACGIGGDLFAVVHEPGTDPVALNASGRAGSGADPDGLRSEGRTEMPERGDIRSVTVPGCVDGWVALHGRFGRLPLSQVLEPAIGCAAGGFEASDLLAGALALLGRLEWFTGHDDVGTFPAAAGDVMRRPRLARTLELIAEGGRQAFYEGDFGSRLVEIGRGEFTAADLRQPLAGWQAPLRLRAWGHDLWAPPPNSQAYLALAGAFVAQRAGLSADRPSVGDPSWPGILFDSLLAAGRDRIDVLHEDADGSQLLAPARLEEQARQAIEWIRRRSAPPVGPASGGDTTYLAAVGPAGEAVSLIQSNAADFGSLLAVPGTGVLLHNRGIGFSLHPGHPSEHGPRRRPPHTLSPLLVTDAGGRFRAAVGTMGGDVQPYVIVQLLARLLAAGQPASVAVGAGRFAPQVGGDANRAGFNLWSDGPSTVLVEDHAPPAWIDGLRSAGREVVVIDDAHRFAFGHAHVIERCPDGILAGAADPRADGSSAAGL